MSRLAAAHRALSDLYAQGAEATIDHLLNHATCLCLADGRCFCYVDALGGCWMMLEITQPEFMGYQRWLMLLE